MPMERVKVKIRCKRCGERFTLRGRKENEKYDTGFKRCLCNNESDFDISIEQI